MNHSPFPKNNGRDIDDDFLNLTLSVATSSSVSKAAPTPASAPTASLPLPELSHSPRLTSASPPSSNPISTPPITPQSSNNPSSSPSITPRSFNPNEFDPVLYYPHIWYHQNTAMGDSSYQQPTGGPWFYQPTPVGGLSYHQCKDIGGTLVHQPTFVGGSPQNHPIFVEGSSHHDPMVVGGPSNTTSVHGSSHHQPMSSFGGPSGQQPTAVRGPSRQQPMEVGGKMRKTRLNRRTTIRLKPGKTATIPPPYPWATSHRAILHNLEYIQSKGINTISGRVKCTECNQEFDMEYDLQTKFQEMKHFVIENKDAMSQRAPEVWRSPAVPDCKFCNQKKCAKPIWVKRRSINWLFLLLGQMIGCCKLAELKYFCKHTRNHRTGAKDRVLYATYMELCRQLDPLGDYDP